MSPCVTCVSAFGEMGLKHVRRNRELSVYWWETDLAAG